MTTASSIFVTHGDEGDVDEPFTVKLALKPGKGAAARILRQFCKVRNGKRPGAPLDAEDYALAHDAAGARKIASDDDVRFVIPDGGVAFVPWTQTARGAASEFRDANVRELSHRVADIDMKIDAWATSRRVYFDNKHDVWILDRRRIAAKYLRGWCVVDLASIVPYDIFADDSYGGVHFLRLMRFSRALKLIPCRASAV
ncbi:voltage-gated potassium channel [Aureococcus anophagefferens]|nr:voltage-gated potassium channel [Aureococcus anophagefferens]